uniref:PAP-associated domain-containing protein n=1 Tax=Strongyloides stercoralis TaxID=6248 RepID=A0AAF5D7B8_STRER
MSLLTLYLTCFCGTFVVLFIFFIILFLTNQYLQKLRSIYQKEEGRKYLSINRLSSYGFSTNYVLMEGNNDDEWNDSILSKPSDILCRDSIQSGNIILEELNLPNQYNYDIDISCNNKNASKSRIIPISVMEKSLDLNVTVLEDVFNEEIRTKLCSTRKRYPGDESQ